jgi:hypothetical protein
MRVEKEKHKVNIFCQDGSSVRGTVHINPGERILDFMNDGRESFIAVTQAEFFYPKDIKSFQLSLTTLHKKPIVILNKSTIKWLEEI